MTALPDILIGGAAPRIPFHARHLPPIANLCRRAFHVHEQRWKKRLFKAPTRLLFDLAWHALGWGGSGTIEVDLPEGAKPFSFDARHLHFYATYKTHNAHGHEPEVAALLESLLKGRRVFYDVGSNWGYFSLYAATIRDYRGPIHAFEPLPETFADLEQVVRQLGLTSRIACHAKAVSDRSGSGTMTIPDPLHSGIARLGKGVGGIRVALARLDDLDLPPPFLMKIDVEEHEFEALSGASAMLHRDRPLIVFENWIQKTRPGATLRPLHYLEALGYVLFDPCWFYPDGEEGYVWPFPDPPARAEPATLEGRRLALIRFSADQRPTLREQINVFACHRERLSTLDGAFAPKVSSR